MTDSEHVRCTSPPEDALDTAIGEVLGSNNPHSYSTITFIERRLIQFKLSSRLEAHEILNEAYLRGKEFIGSGGTITNPHSWLKGTCLNIIREKNRQQYREQLTAPELVELLPALKATAEGTLNPLVTQQNLEDSLKILLSALQILSSSNPEGAKLLRLQSEGLSWKEIHQYILQQKGKAPSESALRQKGCRAKKNLRKIYHAMTQDLIGS
ncbi:hypothetical protein [Lyngbya aestuarii]|uniref:hypothetical protein n=1 Tax=Lyngbya aestuarii TaxID=118322 RepID=UPI00403DE2DA